MQEAKQILEQVSNLTTIASESLNTVRGPLRVGCLESLAPMITPSWCLVLAARSRRAVDPGRRQPRGAAGKLRSGELDIALTYDLVTSPDIDFQPWRNCRPM
jgi:DNA-binding transcriptional LysR family regulator